MRRITDGFNQIEILLYKFLEIAEVKCNTSNRKCYYIILILNNSDNNDSDNNNTDNDSRIIETYILHYYAFLYCINRATVDCFA